MLKVTTEPQENCEVLMTVEVDQKQTDKLLKAAAQRISKQVKIPGFRPGKVPYNLVVRRFGEEVIRDEALEDLGKSVFKQALEQAKLEPYAQASLQDVSWDPLVMKVRVPVAPIVELGDYRAMRMEAEPIEVTEAEVEEALEDLQDEYAVWNPVERPAQLGDLIVMTVREQVGDEVLAEDENVEYELRQADEDEPTPDLTTHLLGLSAGDEKEFSVTYPQDADDPRYAGKEVTVSVRVHGVKEKELYPLNDDFAQTVGDFDTLEQLKEKLKESIHERKERQADRKLGEEALQKLIENAERIEWPKALEEEEIDERLEEQDRRLQEVGLSLDNYLVMQKKTREELREEFRPAVQEQLRRALVLSKLAELEDLSLSGSELAERVSLISRLARGSEHGQLYEALMTPENLRRMANDILTSKVIQRLALIARGQAEALEAEHASGGEGEDTGPDQQAAAAKEMEEPEEVEEQVGTEPDAQVVVGE
ncbi:MAG: trigger factor [Anaerolineae bacterium]